MTSAVQFSNNNNRRFTDMDSTINLREILRLHSLHRAGDPAGKRAVLTGADLSGTNLAGADLREADLTGAVLRLAVLCGADLREADLRWADLCGANLAGVIGLPSVGDAPQRLRAVAAAILANPGALDMRRWHNE